MILTNTERNCSKQQKEQVFIHINIDYQAIVRELRQNFARKDAENLNKIDQLKRSQAGYKKQIANLKSYMRQMLGLLD